MSEAAGAPQRQGWHRVPLWARIVGGGVLLAPITAMLLWSLVVMVWVGLHMIFGVGLPRAFEGGEIGQIGDVFGGLLGPILSTSVLVVTITIALGERRQIEKLRREDAADAERARAEHVTAWMAETQRTAGGESYLGVVVSNGGSTSVRNVDLIVGVDHLSPDREFPNREAIIPPGTWFLPLNHEEATEELEKDASEREKSGRDQTVELRNHWATAIAVDSSGHLRVEMPREGNDRAGDESFVLGIHQAVRVEGEPSPYYKIALMRFEYEGKYWWRDGHGALHRTIPPEHAARVEGWEDRFTSLAWVPRPAAKAATSMHEKDPGTQKFIHEFAAYLTGRTVETIARDTQYDVGQGLKQLGIDALRISRAGQGVAFSRREGDGYVPMMWLSGRKTEIPAVLGVDKGWREHPPMLRGLRGELQQFTEPQQMAEEFVTRLTERVKKAKSPAPVG